MTDWVACLMAHGDERTYLDEYGRETPTRVRTCRLVEVVNSFENYAPPEVIEKTCAACPVPEWHAVLTACEELLSGQDAHSGRRAGETTFRPLKMALQREADEIHDLLHSVRSALSLFGENE
jgi:hypothetical protein